MNKHILDEDAVPTEPMNLEHMHLTDNPYYKLHIGDLSLDSSTNSQKSVTEQEAGIRAENTAENIVHKSDTPHLSAEIQACIQKGITVIENTKKHLEHSISQKIQEAQTKLSLRAESQHASFTTMSGTIWHNTWKK
jgi:hypothetical protein